LRGAGAVTGPAVGRPARLPAAGREAACRAASRAPVGAHSYGVKVGLIPGKSSGNTEHRKVPDNTSAKNATRPPPASELGVTSVRRGGPGTGPVLRRAGRG